MDLENGQVEETKIPTNAKQSEAELLKAEILRLREEVKKSRIKRKKKKKKKKVVVVEEPEAEGGFFDSIKSFASTALVAAGTTLAVKGLSNYITPKEKTDTDEVKGDIIKTHDVFEENVKKNDAELMINILMDQPGRDVKTITPDEIVAKKDEQVIKKIEETKETNDYYMKGGTWGEMLWDKKFTVDDLEHLDLDSLFAMLINYKCGESYIGYMEPTNCSTVLTQLNKFYSKNKVYSLTNKQITIYYLILSSLKKSGYYNNYMMDKSFYSYILDSKERIKDNFQSYINNGRLLINYLKENNIKFIDYSLWGKVN